MNTEAIINGDFEFGSLTNWNFAASQSSSKDTISVSGNRTGTYGLRMRGGGNNELEYILSSPVKVSKIISFGMWIRNAQNSPMSSLCKVYYTDGTYNANVWYGNWYDQTWHYIDLLAILTSNKIVKRLIFNCTGINSYYIYVDDVSLIYKASPPIPSIFVRVKKCIIGSDENNTYEWYGIKKLTFGDVDPWVHIEIPAGLMLHQHLKPTHLEGEIVVNDLGALYEALFETEINSNGDTAINPSNGRKYSVEYILFTLVNQEGTEYQIILDGFKVNTVSTGGIELGTEAVWIVRFTADRVSYP